MSMLLSVSMSMSMDNIERFTTRNVIQQSLQRQRIGDKVTTQNTDHEIALSFPNPWSERMTLTLHL